MKLNPKFYPLFVALLAIFAVAPLEYPGAFQSQTGLTAVYNLINLDQAPLQFWNWSPTLAGNFDLFRIDGALPYLCAEIIHRIGFGYLDSIKLVYALAWVASGLTMFALARKYVSENGALLAATVYVYLPFHIATIYVRGAFAEAVAWAIFPLALLALMRPTTTNRRPRDYIGQSLPFAILFLVQPGIAILFSFVAFVIAVALDRQPSAIRNALMAIVGGLLTGAILDLPTILHYGAIIVPNGFNANYVLPFQLFSSLWGFGSSTGSFLDQFPLQIGVVPIGLAIIAVALAFQKSSTPPPSHTFHRLIIIFLSCACVLTLLTFEIAAPLWKLLGAFASYPWQLLAIVGLGLALIAGAVIDLDARFAQPAMLAFFVALPVVASYNYLAPRNIQVNPDRPAVAIFNHKEIALWSYRIVGPLRHGATDRIQLTWQALRPIDHDYTIFVHAVHDNGNTYAQDDSKPQDGALTTLKWTPGAIISDTHTIQIDIDGPSEGYHLELGMYNAATGERALTETGADQLILPRPGDAEPFVPTR